MNSLNTQTASHSVTPEQSVGQLLLALERQQQYPVMGLRQALEQLGLLDGQTLDALAGESAELLRGNCTELVKRGLLTFDQLGQALARMFGLPHVDLAKPQAVPVGVARMLRSPTASPVAPATNLKELLTALEEQRRLPITTLRNAIAQLGLMSAATLDALEASEPRLLRDRSHELVVRALLAPDELGHALARTAAIPDVDVLRFQVGSDAFSVMPLAAARSCGVVPLGLAGDIFFVAAGRPTDEALHRRVCGLVGGTVALAWARDELIHKRLDMQSGAGAGAPPLAEMTWVPPPATAG